MRTIHVTMSIANQRSNGEKSTPLYLSLGNSLYNIFRNGCNMGNTIFPSCLNILLPGITKLNTQYINTTTLNN